MLTIPAATNCVHNCVGGMSLLLKQKMLLEIDCWDICVFVSSCVQKLALYLKTVT